jgi:hypothetical protein
MNDDHASNVPALADYRLYPDTTDVNGSWSVFVEGSIPVPSGPTSFVMLTHFTSLNGLGRIYNFPSHDSALYFAQSACEDDPERTWGYVHINPEMIGSDGAATFEPKDEDDE